jgi:hypothetical protein
MPRRWEWRGAGLIWQNQPDKHFLFKREWFIIILAAEMLIVGAAVFKNLHFKLQFKKYG